MSAAAQNIYIYGNNVWKYIDDLYRGVDAYYEQTGMALHNPARAEYLGMRAAWNAVLAPILHGMEIHLARWLLRETRELSDVSQLVTPGQMTDTTFDRYTLDHRDVYTGKDLAFMRASSAWSVYAAEDFLHQMNGGGYTSWCRPVWQAFTDLHPEFCALEAAEKQQYIPGFQRNTNPWVAVMSIIADTNSLALTGYDQVAKHIVDWGYPKGTNPAIRMLEKSEELSWQASTKRIFLAANFPKASKPGRKCPVWHEPHNQQSMYAVASLANGPWPVTGYCPGNVLLTAPLLDQACIVEELFSKKEEQSDYNHRWFPRVFGSARATEMRLVFGAYIMNSMNCMGDRELNLV